MIFDVCFYFFYFDPLRIPNATSQTHGIAAAVFQFHISTEN